MAVIRSLGSPLHVSHRSCIGTMGVGNKVIQVMALVPQKLAVSQYGRADASH
jgi:hypothetical protein